MVVLGDLGLLLPFPELLRLLERDWIPQADGAIIRVFFSPATGLQVCNYRVPASFVLELDWLYKQRQQAELAQATL